MKKIILATLAAAALVACAKEDVVVAPKGEAIAFNNAFVDGTTKAIDPSVKTLTLDHFVVYGTTTGDEDDAPEVNIFPGVAVTGAVSAVDESGNATSGSWSYLPECTQYWINGNDYHFAAVVNGKDANPATAAAETKGTVSVDTVVGMPETISYNSANQRDLLYAEATAEGQAVGNNPAVAFTFSHLLSKVKFTFNNTSANGSNNGYTYKITDIRIENVGLNATCNVTNYPNYTWAIADKTTALFGNIVATGETNEANTDAIDVLPGKSGSSLYERLVVPQAYTDLQVKCRIALLYNGQEVDVENYNKPVSVTLECGHSYNFILSGSVGDPIEFTVTKVDGWVEDNTQYTPNPNN